MAGVLTTDDVLAAAERLGGTPELRKSHARTTPFASGHLLEYAPPRRVQPRLEALLARLLDPGAEPPLLHATGVYMEALLIHPLPDGNGRLARLLFQAALRQSLGLRAPVFPLGPACAANRPALVSAYLALELRRDAAPLLAFVTAALTSLVGLYERTKGPSAPAAPCP